jgi:predicted ATP-grasp superfamily ATP-dependent carboligase
MDVARALYLDMTGQPVPRTQAVEGRKWIVEDFDLFSALRSWKNGALTFRGWVRSLGGIQEAACFAWDDALPFLMMAISDYCELREWSRTRKNSQVRTSSKQVDLPGTTVRCPESR